MVIFDNKDSDRMVSGGLDGVINIWNLNAGKVERRLNRDERREQ